MLSLHLREAIVMGSTAADLLRHSTRSMTHHYSVAQITELLGALEKIKADSGQWNKSLATLNREQEAARALVSPAKVPQAPKALGMAKAA